MHVDHFQSYQENSFPRIKIKKKKEKRRKKTKRVHNAPLSTCSRSQDATCDRTGARNEFKLATASASSPAGTIVSFASRRQQPATTTFLSQIDPARKANFMLRSRRASASLLAHYVFRPAPPSHIIAPLSLSLSLSFSLSFYFFFFFFFFFFLSLFFFSSFFLLLSVLHSSSFLFLLLLLLLLLVCPFFSRFLLFSSFEVRLSGSTVNRAFIIIASRRGG